AVLEAEFVAWPGPGPGRTPVRSSRPARRISWGRAPSRSSLTRRHRHVRALRTPSDPAAAIDRRAALPGDHLDPVGLAIDRLRTPPGEKEGRRSELPEGESGHHV